MIPLSLFRRTTLPYQLVLLPQDLHQLRKRPINVRIILPLLQVILIYHLPNKLHIRTQLLTIIHIRISQLQVIPPIILRKILTIVQNRSDLLPHLPLPLVNKRKNLVRITTVVVSLQTQTSLSTKINQTMNPKRMLRQPSVLVLTVIPLLERPLPMQLLKTQLVKVLHSYSTRQHLYQPKRITMIVNTRTVKRRPHLQHSHTPRRQPLMRQQLQPNIPRSLIINMLHQLLFFLKFPRIHIIPNSIPRFRPSSLQLHLKQMIQNPNRPLPQLRTLPILSIQTKMNRIPKTLPIQILLMDLHLPLRIVVIRQVLSIQILQVLEQNIYLSRHLRKNRTLLLQNRRISVNCGIEHPHQIHQLHSQK